MKNNQELSERKKKILKAIVDRYIDTALPVSSAEILEFYDMDISSATIRNDMAELEEKGYISKPYSSAGRVPSKIGYRYYVDKLIGDNQLSIDELKQIRNAITNKLSKLEDLSKITTKTISELTHYTAIAIPANTDEDIIKDIKFVNLGEDILMVVIMTESGILKQSIIKFDEIVDFGVLKDIEKVFKINLIGKQLKDLETDISKYILKEIKNGITLAIKIIEELNMSINKKEKEMYLTGTKNLLKLAEFQEHENIENFLTLLDDKNILKNAMQKELADNEIEILIGEDLDEKSLKEFSIIKCNAGKFGNIGVVGPNRMNYGKVIQIMKEIFNQLKILDKKNNKNKKNKFNKKQKKKQNGGE